MRCALPVIVCFGAHSIVQDCTQCTAHSIVAFDFDVLLLRSSLRLRIRSPTHIHWKAQAHIVRASVSYTQYAYNNILCPTQPEAQCS